MHNQQVSDTFAELATPQITDACLRLGIRLRVGPPGIRPLAPNDHIAGRALPVTHYGSVDIFLEAIEIAAPGDILVVDNGGRPNEGCIGDLTAIEAQAARLAGMVIWGAHRDTREILDIGFPVFSYGNYSAGPTRRDPRKPDALGAARFGEFTVSRDDLVFADVNGVVFAPANRAEDILAEAHAVREREREQVAALRAGKSLREQFRFKEYLARRAEDPTYSFRDHLRTVGGAMEE